ncbi:MAG: YidC/Oxa1 family membrane protein insertase, partial [Lentisphaerae bacterium]|nr:YidC/Oxa1 family membrane protein insertase [Lentisphaerota bacterium]
MKKSDFILVAALFALLISWPMIAAKLGLMFGIEPPQAEQPIQSESEDIASADQEIGVKQAPFAEKKSSQKLFVEDPINEPGIDELFPIGVEHNLATEKLHLKLTTRGAGITSAKMPDYRETVDPESDPVFLDFAQRPA